MLLASVNETLPGESGAMLRPNRWVGWAARSNCWLPGFAPQGFGYSVKPASIRNGGGAPIVVIPFEAMKTSPALFLPPVQ